jgi:hypothetical protein
MLAAVWERLMHSVHVAAARPDEASPASAETIQHARRLLGELPESIVLPQATVSADGEIILTWFRADDRLETILAPDHHLTWVLRIEGNILDGGDVALDDRGSLEVFFRAVADFYE